MAARTADRRPLGAFGRMGLVAAAHAALLLGIAGGLGIVPALEIDPMVTRFYDPPTPPPPEDPQLREPQLQDPTQILLPRPEPLPVPVEASEDTITGELTPVDEDPAGRRVSAT